MQIFVLWALAPLAWAAAQDVKTREIPNETVLLLLATAAAQVALTNDTFAAAAIGLVAVGAPLLLCAMHMGGVGGGDVKLCAALGALLGAGSCYIVLLLALLLLILFGAVAKQKTLPFAPFALAALLILTLIRS